SATPLCRKCNKPVDGFTKGQEFRRGHVCFFESECHGEKEVSDARIPRARPARFLMRQRYSVADAVGTTAGCTSGTSNAESGAASSSGRSRARVADQCLGDSSRYRSRGQYGRTRKISSRYVKGSRR